MSLISQKDIDDIKSALVELAPYTEEPIVFKRFDHIIEGNSVMGKPDQAFYDSLNITAMIRDLTVEDIAKSAGFYLMGDTEFSIRTTLIPSTNDRIEHNGFIWKPKKIEKVFLGEVLWWEITARKE